jgi:hypothetical protein
MSTIEATFIALAVLTLLVAVLSEVTFYRVAAAADERKLQSMERVGRGLIAAAKICAILTLIMTATFILTRLA